MRDESDIPITTPPTLAAISPNLGSVICFDRNVRIGSNATSSRPLRATRSPSRWINSWIRANDIDGRTVWLLAQSECRLASLMRVRGLSRPNETST